MEFLIFFGFWHKNSVIFREIFVSGEENEQQRKKKKINRTLENYRILSDHLRHCRSQLFVFFWPFTEI